MRTDSSITRVLTAAAVVLTVASQFGWMRDSSLFLMLWATLVLFGICHNARVLEFGRPQKLTLLTLCIAGAYSCSMTLFSGELGYLTGFFLLLVKSVMIYFIGWSIAPSFASWREKQNLIVVYSVAVFAYTLWAVLTYVPNFSGWLGTMTYLYSSKNSYGQIAGAALLAMEYVLVVRRPKKLLHILLACCSAITVLTGMVLLQCRTTILAVLVASAVLFVSRGKKTWLAVLLMTCACLYFLVPSLRQIVDHVMLVDKYAGSDLNTFSSGRFQIWAGAWEVFLEHSAFGTGSFYVDNFFLNCLVNVGLVGAIIYFSFLVYRAVLIGRSSYMRDAGSSMSTLMVMLGVFYFIESLLEGQPPLGPGACSFFFWLLCGFEDTDYSQANNGCQNRRAGVGSRHI